MEKYLPTVTKEVAISSSINISEYNDDSNYVESKIEEIKNVNPVVAEWIDKFSKQTDDYLGASMCGVMVYNMIYSQAEAEFMNEHFT